MNKLQCWVQDIKHRKKGDIEETKRRIEEATKNAEVGSPEWVALRAAMEQEQKIENMKKEKKGFLGISNDKWLGAALVVFGLTLTLIWDTESPAAMKLSKLVWDTIKKA